MRNTHRATLMVVVLSLLTIGTMAPAAARGCGEEVAFTAVADFITEFDPGEIRVEGSKLHVRGASLAYDVIACAVGDCPIDRSRYSINYTVDLETKVGMMWGTWESENPEGLRGIHFGTISSFESPESFSFEARSIGWGAGMLLSLRGESDSAGAVTQLSGKVFR